MSDSELQERIKQAERELRAAEQAGYRYGGGRDPLAYDAESAALARLKMLRAYTDRPAETSATQETRCNCPAGSYNPGNVHEPGCATEETAA